MDHKHLVSPEEKREITSRGYQTVYRIKCPHCGGREVVKYAYYKDKSITYFKCKKCVMRNTGKCFTFAVRVEWR